MTTMPRSANAAYHLVTSASLDVYEATARAVSELGWALARCVQSEPLSSLAATCADITRDVAAVQLSTARWLLDL